MQEYMESGARLGWFIDPIARTVRIYRAGVAEPELLQDPETLDGEDVLSGFIFPVRELIFNLVAIPDTAE
jgi:Uma2 family endonuclease